MNKAWNEFQNSLVEIRKIRTIYDHLVNTIHLSEQEVSDLLRSQLVNTVSALDRFLHELVRIGIVEAFLLQRTSTKKFKSFTLRSQTIIKILEIKSFSTPYSSTEEEKSYWINEEVAESLKSLSFQHPNKIKDALSYIWEEDHKWQLISNEMNLPGNTPNDKQKYLEQTLILICERRNQIVHEADIDPITHIRRKISTNEVENIIDFIEKFANHLYTKVKI